MKEAQLINMKKRLDSLTQLVRSLIKEIQANATLAQGVLTAFQLHLGEEEWNKLLEELKDKEKREIEQEKKLDLDVE
jgi:hypothetical protein